MAVTKKMKWTSKASRNKLKSDIKSIKKKKNLSSKEKSEARTNLYIAQNASIVRRKRMARQAVSDWTIESRERFKQEKRYKDMDNMRKAFKSSVIENRRIVSENKDLVDKNLVTQAVTGIRKLAEEMEKKKKADVTDLSGDDLIMMQVTLTKLAVPLEDEHVKRTNIIRVILPHSVVTKETDVLLITPAMVPTKYKSLLRNHRCDQMISEIISVRELHSEYTDYESKRALSSRVDVVLADTKAQDLPQLLGKHFYRHHKLPNKVNLRAKKLKKQIVEALKVSHLVFTRGTCALMKIGRISQTDKQIEENILEAVKKLSVSVAVPGMWSNVQNISLKLKTSTSIPFYINHQPMNNVGTIASRQVFHKKVITGEITTLPDKQVSIYPDGNVFVDHSKAEKNRRRRVAKITKERKEFRNKLLSMTLAERRKFKAENKKKRLLQKRKTKRAEEESQEDEVVNEEKDEKSIDKKRKKSKKEVAAEEEEEEDYKHLDLEAQEQKYLEKLNKKRKAEDKKKKGKKAVDVWAEDSDDGKEIDSDMEVM